MAAPPPCKVPRVRVLAGTATVQVVDPGAYSEGFHDGQERSQTLGGSCSEGYCGKARPKERRKR